MFGDHRLDKDAWERLKVGCCMDCFNLDRKANQISFWCDGCRNPFICAEHEFMYEVCMECRLRNTK